MGWIYKGTVAVFGNDWVTVPASGMLDLIRLNMDRYYKIMTMPTVHIAGESFTGISPQLFEKLKKPEGWHFLEQ